MTTVNSELTEYGCTWDRDFVPDGGAGHELTELLGADWDDSDDSEWLSLCDELERGMRDALCEQAPCATWYSLVGGITVCVRHMDRIDPRAAWVAAHARMVEGASKEQS